MFRNNNEEKFGAGSTVVWRSPYLVVAEGLHSVRLVLLPDCKIKGDRVEVVDPYHLSREEAEKLIKIIDHQATFTDFTFNPNSIAKSGGAHTINTNY